MSHIISKACTIALLFILLASNMSVWASLPHQTVSDKVITMLGQVARNNLGKAKLSDGSFVPPETAAEKAKPLLPHSDMRRVVEHGVYAETMNVCGLNWENGFRTFMASERGKHQWTDKQISYIGFLHGLSMGFYSEPLQQTGCTPEMKAYFHNRH